MAPREPYDAHASPAGLRINLLGPVLVTLEGAEAVAYIPPEAKGPGPAHRQPLVRCPVTGS